ncbi:type II toxin-antitoxin system VapC family toxin [Microbacterium sp.]|uniref:type II toxin-antitoxin system VapC family toxin n=1 Tax=Microbacterium sp. TaxID=51671 RepID=UPI0039E4D3A6
MTVLDASVLIAYLGSDDHSPAATAILRDQERPSIHAVTLAEVLVGPAGRGTEEAALAAVDELGIRTLAHDPDEPLLVARLRASTRLLLPDCFPLAAALRGGVTLATFDKRLAAAARALEVTVVGA